jgi:site-specific DNA-methyltransferase (adenine-specific)
MTGAVAAQVSAVHVPDVLETLAQLPNDDVYTPPKVVAAMLDILPEHVWSEASYTWLDPATKSGIYLREVFKRLMVSLAEWEPDGAKRREHILRNMLYGAATTQLNGDIARRTLYQTKNATGVGVKDPALADLVVHFDDPDGNILYVETEHTLDRKEQFCTTCRAPAKLIRERRESFAYSFIHGTYPAKEVAEMKFDVIIGNPPYQIGMDDGKGNRTANITPLYNLFVEKAIAMNPRYVVMITPSRWFAGGKGLVDYRGRMIADRRLRTLVDNPKLYDVFPQAEIKGGVSYFLWDRDHDGDCEFSTRVEGLIRDTSTRDLRLGRGIVLRDNFGAEIVGKIASDPLEKGSLADKVSARDPFGQAIKTNYDGHEEKKTGTIWEAYDEPGEGRIPLVYINKVRYVQRGALQRKKEWVDRCKVLIPMAGDGHGRDVSFVIGEPLALAPGSACTQSYLVAGTFDTAAEAEHYAYFLTTKFVRFLILQRKISQHLTNTRFAFVPLLEMTRRWADADLYERFNLTSDEIAYIERVIGPREPILSLDSPIPSTHLPGGRKYRAGDAPIDADETGDDE